MGEDIKNGSEVIGSRTKCKVVKNKVSPPFKECEFDLYFGKGISREGEVLDLAVDLNIINKSGAWFSYDGNKIGQGRENTKEWLKNNPDKMKEIEEKIKERSKEVVLVSKKSKKSAAADTAAEESAGLPAEETYADAEEVSGEPPVNVIIDADDDFEEFTPVKS